MLKRLFDVVCLIAVYIQVNHSVHSLVSMIVGSIAPMIGGAFNTPNHPNPTFWRTNGWQAEEPVPNGWNVPEIGALHGKQHED